VPLFGGLTGSEFFRLDLGILVLFMGWTFYLSLDWKLGIPFALLTLGLYFMGRSLPLWANLVIWIIGWIVQFIGHGVYEKKSPAFLKSLEHLLIGPFWMFARLVGYIR
jgi:uncharacterized membrane protein YGL010W